MCVLTFKNDLEFWGLPDTLMESCCRDKYESDLLYVLAVLRGPAASLVLAPSVTQSVTQFFFSAYSVSLSVSQFDKLFYVCNIFLGGSYDNSILRYDPINDTWNVTGKMSTSRENFSVGLVVDASQIC